MHTATQRFEDDACKAETTDKAEAGEKDKANFSQAPALSSQSCSQGLKQVAIIPPQGTPRFLHGDLKRTRFLYDHGGDCIDLSHRFRAFHQARISAITMTKRGKECANGGGVRLFLISEGYHESYQKSAQCT